MTLVASIVITAYNEQPGFLFAAIDSARRQTVPVEIIVVDDGSDDFPAWTLCDLTGCVDDCVRYVRHDKNRGISAALNTGIKAMTTEWFCWLPSDDLFRSEKVETQLGRLVDAAGMASFHRYYTFSKVLGDEPIPQAVSNRWDWDSHRRQKRALGIGCCINGLTVMLHRSVFDDVGMFDESYRYGQDWEMWCRVTQSYPWLAIDDVLAYRRTDGTNLTSRIEANPELRRVRDAEDMRIRRQYGAA